MKKALPILLCLMLLLPFASCSFIPHTAAADPTQEAVTEAPTEASSPVPTDTPTPTQAPTEAPSPAPSFEPEAMLRPGNIYGSCYENRTLGYGIYLDGWHFANESELAEINNSLIAITPRELQSALQNSDSYLEMYSEAPGGMQSINIVFQSIKRVYGDENISTDSIVDHLLLSIPGIFGAMGISDVEYSDGTITLQDTFPAVFYEYELDGIMRYQTQFLVRRGEFLCTVAITSLGEDNTSEVLNCFYRLPGEYDWGTGFDEIFAAEVNEYMTENRDYFIEDGEYFVSKELSVYAVEYGCYFVDTYSFDLDGGLVSVEKVCAGALERDEEIELGFRLIKETKALYGEPSKEKNPYYEAQYGGYDLFVEKICSGQMASSEITWNVENGDRFMIGLERGDDRLILVVCRYSKDAR